MGKKHNGIGSATVSCGENSKCGYTKDVSHECNDQALLKPQEVVNKTPRGGIEIDSLYHDVAEKEPSNMEQLTDSDVPKNGDFGEASQASNSCTHSTDIVPDAPDVNENDIVKYNNWLKEKQKKRHSGKEMTSPLLGIDLIRDVKNTTEKPPKFEHTSLFYPGAEEYAFDMTSLSSPDFKRVTEETVSGGLFAPCMVGKIEGQFLKMITQVKAARRVLDVGTFTGYSALAFAHGMSSEGLVVTVEANKETAEVAQKVFAGSKHGGKIKLLQKNARSALSDMVKAKEKFDIVFLDADKVNYVQYYEAGLHLLNDDGILLADNALCSLVFDSEDPMATHLHRFAEHVRNDPRVEQVMMTVREGILMVRKV